MRKKVKNRAYRSAESASGGFETAGAAVRRACRALSRVCAAYRSGIFLAAILFLPRFYEIRPVWTWWSLLLVPLLIGTLLLIYGMSRLTNRFMDRFYRKQAERQKRRGVF